MSSSTISSSFSRSRNISKLRERSMNRDSLAIRRRQTRMPSSLLSQLKTRKLSGKDQCPLSRREPNKKGSSLKKSRRSRLLPVHLPLDLRRIPSKLRHQLSSQDTSIRDQILALQDLRERSGGIGLLLNHTRNG